MKSRTVMKSMLLWALVAYFLFHPFLMVIIGLMAGTGLSGQASIFRVIPDGFGSTFSLKMLPWGAGLTVLGALIGLFHGKLILAKKTLQRAHDELQNQVEQRTLELQRVNEQLGSEVTECKLKEEAVQRASQDQGILHELLQVSLEEIPLVEMFEKAIDIIIAVPWLNLERKGCIFLVDKKGGDALVMKAQRGLPDSLKEKCARISFGTCLCGRAAASLQVEFADRIDERHDIRYEGIYPHGHYCIPLLSGYKALGVLNFYLREGYHPRKEEEEFLKGCADVLAGIIERKSAEQRLYDTLESLRKAVGGTIRVLALTVETRDPYTAGHQRRVADLARAIATEMSLPPDRIDAIRMAGVIHDLGKISVPAEILSKPTRLSDLEFALIKTHPQVAFDLLKTVDFPWPIAQIVYQHHERMDGSGYPRGLRGEELLLEARVLAVADVVEAMASHRPYRAALGIEKGLEEISQNSGTRYDPDVVDACLRLFSEREYLLKDRVN